MNFKIKIKEKIYDVDISEKSNETVSIKVGDRSFSFPSSSVSNEGELTVSEFAQNQKILSSKELKASIGGTISEIFVREGEAVKQGQKILTLLAMKMENEIVADSEGVVKKILVKPDQAVKEGELLILFE
jgi:biotin carboxyl carrier protein